MTFYAVAEEMIGEQRALQIANEIGRRYASDKNLKRVDVIKCLCRGADSCEQHWVYKD